MHTRASHQIFVYLGGGILYDYGVPLVHKSEAAVSSSSRCNGANQRASERGPVGKDVHVSGEAQSIFTAIGLPIPVSYVSGPP